MMEFSTEKDLVAAFMRRLYEQKLTSASGGNISMRINNRILITPSQKDKAFLTGDDILIMTLEGKCLSENMNPSMECKIHLAVYNRHPKINAIVHAHPVVATAFIVAGKPIKTNLTGESYAMLGRLVSAPYALMGSKPLSDLVAEASMAGHVILMQNHGVVTTGKTLFEAYDRMEVLEACAKLNMITEILGDRKELSESEMRAIDDLFMADK
ncbi:MAG: class II aldolase/adducin family protein [Bacteroidales bacterium]